MREFDKTDQVRRFVLRSAAGYFSRPDATGHGERLLKDFDPGYSQIGRLNASPRACAKVISSSAVDGASIALNAVACGRLENTQ